MRKLKNKLAVLFVLVISLNCTVNIFALELTHKERQNEIQAINAAANLSIIMGEILNTYLGNITIDDLYEAALIGITEVLDDFSRFYSEKDFLAYSENTNGNIVTYGFMVAKDIEDNIIVYSVFDGSKAKEVGILENDIIKNINGVPVEGLSLDDILEIVRLNTSENLNIDILRNEEILKFTLQEEIIVYNTVSIMHFDDIFNHTFNDDNDHIRYIKISTMGQDTAEEFKNHIELMQNEGVEKIVLDLRGNLGGYLDAAIEISNILLPEGTIMFIADNDNSKSEVVVNDEKKPFKEIIVLVDNNTASSAEVIVAALQDTGSIVIGNTTYGKGTIQTALELPSGGVLMLTTHESLRRTGEPLNNVGVVPDIFINIPDLLLQSDLDRQETFTGAMEILKFLGYEVGDINNERDTKNIEAIRKFQFDNDLEVNSTIDTQTIIELNKHLFIIIFDTDIALEMAYDIIYN